MSASNRIYIGGINPQVRRDDVEKFLKGLGRVKDIIMKNGFCFVEFDSRRDASDAVHDLHGRELLGNRVSVESAHGTPHGRDRMLSGSRSSSGSGGYGYSSSRYSSSGYGGRYGGDRERRYRAAPPVRSSHRVVVENLSNGVSWQDLKNFVRQAADVVYADVFSSRNEGIVEFSSLRDMKRALEQLDGADFHGRRLKMVEDRRPRSSSSQSPHRSGGGSRRRRSDSRNDDDARSGGGSRSRSRSRGASAKKSKSRRRSPSSSRSKSASSRSSRSSPDRRSPVGKSGESSRKSKDKSKEREGSSDKKNGMSSKQNEGSGHDD